MHTPTHNHDSRIHALSLHLLACRHIQTQNSIQQSPTHANFTCIPSFYQQTIIPSEARSLLGLCSGCCGNSVTYWILVPWCLSESGSHAFSVDIKPGCPPIVKLTTDRTWAFPWNQLEPIGQLSRYKKWSHLLSTKQLVLPLTEEVSHLVDSQPSTFNHFIANGIIVRINSVQGECSHYSCSYVCVALQGSSPQAPPRACPVAPREVSAHCVSLVS